jgi:hypothetical protein
MSRIQFIKQKPVRLNFFWLTWFLIVLIVFLIHCLTISISPTIWQDEVQIIDYGRYTLGATDWSVNWNFLTNKPFVAFSYLANTLQELALRLTHFSVFGPRLASVLGAIAAATVALLWLLVRNVSARAAWIISLVFLLDPLFVQGYRGARVDCWVFALCLGSCFLLRIAQRHLENTTLVNVYSAFAGCLAIAAFFTWPSAILLYPLISLEFFSLVSALRATSKEKRIVYYTMVSLILGGISTIIFLLLPILPQVSIAFSDTTGLANSRSGFSQLLDMASWRSLLESFKFSPFLPLVALVTLRYRFQIGLAIVTLLATALIISTNVYIHRAVYLLPYLIALVGGICSNRRNMYQSATKQPRLKLFILVLLLIWASSISLISRPAIALNQRELRSPNQLEEVARSSIGTGEHKVFLVDAYEFYHAGRKLGWQMFSDPFLVNSNLKLSDEKFQNFLDRLDYVVSSKKMNPDLKSALSKANFKHQSTILEDTNNKVASGLATARPYGPYVLYSK